jgi:hypothetical protein
MSFSKTLRAYQGDDEVDHDDGDCDCAEDVLEYHDSSMSFSKALGGITATTRETITMASGIAPSILSNMVLPSQFVASAKVKRSDRKGDNANRDIDHVEEKDGHWGSFLVHRCPRIGASLATYKSTFDKMRS